MKKVVHAGDSHDALKCGNNPLDENINATETVLGQGKQETIV